MLVLLVTVGRWMLYAPRVMVDSEPKLGFVVDINHADAATLAALPGLGPTTARRVIEDRNTRGRFETPQQLARVKGIGDITVRHMLPYIICGPGVTYLPLTETQNATTTQSTARPE